MQRLNSWKEIADYLGVTVRTAQNWERERGLPVRRLPGTRGPVSAVAAELDAWRDSDASRATKTPETDLVLADPEAAVPAPAPAEELVGDATPVAPVRFRSVVRSRYRAAASLLVLALVLVGLVAATRRPPKPASARVENGVLMAFDHEGRQLWTHSFGPALDPALYKVASFDHHGNLPILIGDFGPGETRVLFSLRAAPDSGDSDVLYCFDQRGNELWRFTPGKPVRTATESFDRPYHIRDFKLLPAGNATEIVVTSSHHKYYPNQVALLSADGKLLQEYWHSGQFGHLAVADLNHDGRNLILLTGLNNEYRTATMVVLDPAHFSGASPQTDPRYQLLDMPLAAEHARFYFHKSCVSRATEPYNVAGRVVVTNDVVSVPVWEFLRDRTDEGVNYEFSRDLKLRSVTAADGFFAFHKQLELQRVLDHPFSPAEFQRLSDLSRPRPEER